MRPTLKHPHSFSTPVLLVAILGLTFILRMNFWDQPFQMDEGVYGYIGWGMLDGLVPYKDLFDHKPPGIYLLYSLVFLLTEPTALNIKVFTTIYTFGTVLAVFLVARKVAGEKAGLLAALLFGIFSCGPKIEGGGSNTEIFMILPYTLAVLSLLKAIEKGRRRDYLLTGLWTGVACTIKQVAAVNLLWVGAYLIVRIWRQRKWTTVVRVTADGCWMTVGAILPWVPYLVYFYLNDALAHFYFWQVNFNLDYMASAHGSAKITVFYHRTMDILRENGLLWLLALAATIYHWQELRKGVTADEGENSQSWRSSGWFLMAIWPLFSLLGVVAGGRFFPHYYIQMIPPLAILGGAGLMVLIRKVRAEGIRLFGHPVGLAIILVFIWAILLFVKTDAPYYLIYNGPQISLHQYQTPVFSVTRFVGKYLRNRTQPEDLIYVWAVNPEINFYALRKTPSPFLVYSTSFARLPWDTHAEVMQSLHRAPPRYIVALEKKSAFPALQKFIESDYQEETDPELEELKQIIAFEIYRRKEG